ncbi:MAG: complex I NDUFA9 subunit family protein [Pseudochelatococcus sp.]|jgi:uncharacterized protein YbjT (DUF2867 family)|uniref:complex I NDUFA9 subunit family protein n=1 Tax=Pseudochelatococcus sp. TaxID=2020869 RepID=UPI003D8A3E90
MTTDTALASSQLVTIFGGSGFVGRHVVRALARRGYRIRVAVRRPDLAGHLQPLGTVGQITAVQANVRYRDSVTRAVAGAQAVINLVGILRETGRQNFSPVHHEGAGAVAAAAAAEGARLVHVSAIGADSASPSLYARSKALGEEAVLAANPQATIFRPSVIFGPEDAFFNRFAALARIFPVLPIVGAQTKLQPVFVGDVAEAVARAVDGTVPEGRVYELGGPEVRTLHELVNDVQAVTGRRRPVIALSPGVANIQAAVVETLDKFTFGLLPETIIITRDQVRLLAADNIVSGEAKAEGRTLEGIGIAPTAHQAIISGYLWRFRKGGQFDEARA